MHSGRRRRRLPPTDDDAYLDFAKSLRSLAVYEVIRDAEPLTPIMGFRHTANHRRRYDQLPAWPERFVVLGDAACTFDPVYAQGMTMAAFEAVVLDQWLRSHASAQAFQGRVIRAAASAWSIATAEDQRYPTTEGPPLRLWTRFVNWYMRRVLAAATVDERVCARLLEVLTLRSGPSALFLPPVPTRTIIAAATNPAAPGGGKGKALVDRSSTAGSR